MFSILFGKQNSVLLRNLDWVDLHVMHLGSTLQISRLRLLTRLNQGMYPFRVFAIRSLPQVVQLGYMLTSTTPTIASFAYQNLLFLARIYLATYIKANQIWPSTLTRTLLSSGLLADLIQTAPHSSIRERFLYLRLQFPLSSLAIIARHWMAFHWFLKTNIYR